MRKLILFLVLALIFANPISSQEPAEKVIFLYNDKAPGSEKWDWHEKEYFVQFPINGNIVYNVSSPSLMLYAPRKASPSGSAVLLLPGGGFHFINIEHEGKKLAVPFTDKGITVFILKYRVARSATDNPFSEFMMAYSDSAKFEKDIAPIKSMALEDAKAAMKYIREHAKDFNIRPDKIAVAGFSAGGVLAQHLAADDSPLVRPDFAAFIYTVFQSSISVPRNAPPVFIACASDDKLAGSNNSIMLYNKWNAPGSDSELHIYASGGHGLRTGNSTSWVSRFMEWLLLRVY